MNSTYTHDIKHILSIYDIEDIDNKVFQDQFNTKYDRNQKRLLLFLNEDEVISVMPKLLQVLKDKKATNYELKIKNLYDMI